ncbi:MAG: hypothetical protein B7X37_03045 [Halothiobacillus sp. 14-55-98]|nr:MAG: hypothetical protein B7X37_03045 [Halothiobacillus sp. 14-55-98]
MLIFSPIPQLFDLTYLRQDARKKSTSSSTGFVDKKTATGCFFFDFSWSESPIRIEVKNGILKIKELNQFQPKNLATYQISAQSYPQDYKSERCTY